MAAYLTLVVHIALLFDSSIRSRIVQTTAVTEAAAIWRDYGVVLDFGDRGGAAVCISAFVNRTRAHPDGASAVLGSTFVGPDSDDHAPPIRIGFDLVDELAQPSESANAMVHEYAVGTAIGRVLAHEVGHLLLGPPGYHDPDGLMRRQFLTDDFLPWNRSRYRLALGSIERLRRRMTMLSTRGTAAGCAAS